MSERGIYISLIILSIILISCMNIGAYGTDMITEDGAIKIANNEALKLGYDLKIMSLEANKFSTPWNNCLPKDSIDEYYVEKKDKLKNREYWAIYYYPDLKKVGTGYKGGDFCIFVDANSGEVITYIRWK